jgi:hypothetical protein
MLTGSEEDGLGEQPTQHSNTNSNCDRLYFDSSSDQLGSSACQYGSFGAATRLRCSQTHDWQASFSSFWAQIHTKK